jgi:ribosomal protein S18 acetylase RimI-like enzyme
MKEILNICYFYLTDIDDEMYLYRSHDSSDRMPAVELIIRVYSQEQINPNLGTEDFLGKFRPWHHWTVALVDKTVVGAQFYSVKDDEGYLIDVAVDQSHRRKGIATELTNRALECMKQNKVKMVFTTKVLNANWENKLKGLGFWYRWPLSEEHNDMQKRLE